MINRWFVMAALCWGATFIVLITVHMSIDTAWAVVFVGFVAGFAFLQLAMTKSHAEIQARHTAEYKEMLDADRKD